MSILFIIGAPRSGTNLLRDLLCSQLHIDTWPCDEINYIWRIGRSLNESDFLSSGFNSYQSKYITSKFQNKLDSISTHLNGSLAPVLVEKTCANCLRVDHISNLFPNSKFIYLRRNPYDAVYSSIQRWTGSFDLNYIMQKARFIPKRDILRYAYSFSVNRIMQYLSSDKKLKQWGPILDDPLMPKNLNTVEEICTEQWFMCNHFAELAFSNTSKFNHNNFYTLTYENLISNPYASLSCLFDSLSIPYDQSILHDSTKVIYSNSVGKGKSLLKSHQLAAVDNTIALLKEQVSSFN